MLGQCLPKPTPDAANHLECHMSTAGDERHAPHIPEAGCATRLGARAMTPSVGGKAFWWRNVQQLAPDGVGRGLSAHASLQPFRFPSSFSGLAQLKCCFFFEHVPRMPPMCRSLVVHVHAADVFICMRFVCLKLGQVWFDLGQSRLNSATRVAHRCVVTHAQRWPVLGRVRPSFGPLSAEFGRSRARFGQQWSKSRQLRLSLGRVHEPPR